LIEESINVIVRIFMWLVSNVHSPCDSTFLGISNVFVFMGSIGSINVKK